MSVELGLLGKLRARGDFVRVRAGAEPFPAFDDWLTENMTWAAARAPQGFPEAYASGAIQAFLFRPPGSSRLLSGALGPSEDAAGRRFPLAVAAAFELDAELAAAPHVLPIVHEGVWQAASDLVAEIRETGVDADPARPLQAVELEPLAPAGEALESYRAWALELPLVELWAALYGDDSGVEAGRALRLLAEAVRPYAGVESPKTPLSLRLPLGAAGGAAVCFWLDLVRRWIGWRTTVPSLFWSHDGQSGSMILHVGSPPKNTIAELWMPSADSDEFCDLTRVSEVVVRSLPELPPELAAGIVHPASRVADLVGGR